MEKENTVETLYDKYAERLYSRAEYVLNGEKQARAALTGTFLRVSRHADLFAEEDEEETVRLLAVFLRCSCFDIMRRIRKIKYPTKTELPDHVVSGEKPDNGLISLLLKKENLRWFKDTFSSLGSPFKELCILKFYYNVNTSKAARLLGLRKAEANAILCKKLLKLKSETDHKLNGNVSTGEMGVVMGGVCKKFADEEVRRINSDSVAVSPVPEDLKGEITKKAWLQQKMPMFFIAGAVLAAAVAGLIILL